MVDHDKSLMAHYTAMGGRSSFKLAHIILQRIRDNSIPKPLHFQKGATCPLKELVLVRMQYYTVKTAPCTKEITIDTERNARYLFAPNDTHNQKKR